LIAVSQKYSHINTTGMYKPADWPMVESLDNRKEKIYQTGNTHTSMECLPGWNNEIQ